MKSTESLHFCLSAFIACVLLSATATAHGATTSGRDVPNQMLAAYFRAETEKLATQSLADFRSLQEWEAERPRLRRQLFEMLGLHPLPERTELQPVITGKLEHDQFTVEKLHFQSMPGLYVTANLFLPKKIEKPLPAVLYVCGHANVMTNNVSYGNKTAYHHHAAWFADNGFACLVIDTIQLGEIRGLHHGTYREKMWWWNSRGYTPAGVEAWNGIRALDYLQSRAEIDPQRLGVTGRSGGGAYSWWIAALDDRIKAAVPVAGITDLENHVVDGVVEGHCDCMFVVNTYRWDYPAVAALVAPRPLLIANSDKDSIFPLDGVVRVHAKVASIYKLYGAANALGLLITEGPHKDTQDLQLPAFRWFNRHLKKEDPFIEMTSARHAFTPPELKVFASLPSNERVTAIHESFVPAAPKPALPNSASAWAEQCRSWQSALESQVFRGWPEQPVPLDLAPQIEAEQGDLLYQNFLFRSQPHVNLHLHLITPAGGKPDKIIFHVLDEQQSIDWTAEIRANLQTLTKQELDQFFPATQPAPAQPGTEFQQLLRQLNSRKIALAWTSPRGIGLNAWAGDDRKQIQIRRRFMLLGQTLDGMRVWDIRRALQALSTTDATRNVPIAIRAQNEIGVNALYASLFEPGVAALELSNLPESHRTGPDYLNVLRILDIPQAVALAATKIPVTLRQNSSEAAWQFPRAVAQQLGWSPRQFQMVEQ